MATVKILLGQRFALDKNESSSNPILGFVPNQQMLFDEQLEIVVIDCISGDQSTKQIALSSLSICILTTSSIIMLLDVLPLQLLWSELKALRGAI